MNKGGDRRREGMMAKAKNPLHYSEIERYLGGSVNKACNFGIIDEVIPGPDT